MGSRYKTHHRKTAERIMKKIFWVLIILWLPMYSVFAAEDYYHFDTPQQQQSFERLTNELRCLVCQNQNLAESNAALAVDLRKQIYAQVLQGQSTQQVIDYLVARYGNFILYKPPLNMATVGLWFGPVLLLLVGISYLLFYLRKYKK
jgi:cytochrome c-type biogenesis protein CcmH